MIKKILSQTVKEPEVSYRIAFYMEPEEVHGLGDLLPQALLECIDRGDDFGKLGSGKVSRDLSFISRSSYSSGKRSWYSIE